MNQQLFNVIYGLFGILLSIIGACALWWVNMIWEMVKEQKKEINDLHIRLAEGYMPRAEMNRTLERIFNALDDLRKELAK
jgi:hypothetical protein